VTATPSAAAGVEIQLTKLLVGMNALGGYPFSLICTAEGLLVAIAGEQAHSEVAAGLTALFDDIVVRAGRDLDMGQVDELTLSDAHLGRFVVRPLALGEVPRLFLVVGVPQGGSWRRNTATTARRARKILEPLLPSAPDAASRVATFRADC